jgi:hypothetical protein
MAKELLTNLEVRNLKAPGRYKDGGGLFFVIREGGSKSWSFIYRDPIAKDKFGLGKRVELSLGSFPPVTLSRARAKATEARGLLNETPPRSPLAVRNDQKRRANMPTFEEMSELYVSNKSGEWKSLRHRQQVLANLAEQCRPINGKLINMITTEDVLV